jgi:predicted GIY-YIG superfamily endonuclease
MEMEKNSEITIESVAIILKMLLLYLITSSEGVRYVGITTEPLKHRMSQHHHAIKVGHGDGEKFIHYYNEPGNDFEDADVQIIDRGRDKKELLQKESDLIQYYLQKERHWITHYDSIKNGLNSKLS